MCDTNRLFLVNHVFAGYSKRLLNFSLTGCLLIFTLTLQAQNVISPMDIPLYLSGNFGELRNDHFHSGIDFKTQGVTGIPVKAVKQAYISRISVSPYGYGRAIYLNHPDGTTSVYGHLECFASKIEEAVRDSQYRKESFSVNLHFLPSEFPVKQGEIIAYSGNTGSSGGPHLHFEFRDTKTEKLIDPLPFFKDKLKDNRPPEIRGLLFFPQPGKGIVNGSAGNREIEVIKDKSGKYILSKPVKAWGLVGIGIKAYDRMNGTSNTYGVNEIRLEVDDVVVYHSRMNGFFFDETRYLNSFIDRKEWKENKSFYMKSFIEPGNKLGIYLSQLNGTIPVENAKAYRCKYILKDVYGNTSVLNFSITGEETPIPEGKTDGVLFRYNQQNVYKKAGIQFTIPAGNLYDHVYLKPEVITGYSNFSPLYTFGDRIPLHGYCPLALTLANDSYPNKQKYGIVSVTGDRASWLGGKYELQTMKTRIREIASFSIAIDTLPPVIKPVKPAQWTTNKRISFKITDDLSGIDFYEGRLGGNYVLFEYDAKTDSFFCHYDSKRMKKGKQTLTLIVRDGVGNETKASYEILF
jgi:murein DD-endopeptidase MepM/ murein hydrolase activator NlpD